MTAYEQGRAAARTTTGTVCPFDQRSHEATQWIHGYADKRYEQDERKARAEQAERFHAMVRVHAWGW